MGHLRMWENLMEVRIKVLGYAGEAVHKAMGVLAGFPDEGTLASA
jgi:hypothetical protein